MNGRELPAGQRLREGVKKVLNQQFRLHEVRHHSSISAENSSAKSVQPIAHTLSDIYKCLHQGTFGVGHNITNPGDFKLNLFRELMLPRTASTEPLIEAVSPDGAILRVNLRPFRTLFPGREDEGCELLLQACLESAKMDPGSQAGFFAVLDLFGDLNNSGELSSEGLIFAFPDRMVERFLTESRNFVANFGFVPVMSHSPVYKTYNNPAYRVVHLGALRESRLAAFMLPAG